MAQPGHSQGVKSERRTVRFQILFLACRSQSICGRAGTSSSCIFCFSSPAQHWSTSFAGSQLVLEEPKTRPSDTLGLFIKGQDIFQKTAVIYGSHVMTQRQIIFIAVLDPSVSASYPFCGWQFWSKDRWFITRIALETCLNRERLPAFLRKEPFSPHFDMLLSQPRKKNYF